jgi:hypothetical protein
MHKVPGAILIFVGLVFLGLTVPLFGLLVNRAMIEGNLLANLAFVILVGVTGLVMLLVGWSLLRRR